MKICRFINWCITILKPYINVISKYSLILFFQVIWCIYTIMNHNNIYQPTIQVYLLHSNNRAKITCKFLTSDKICKHLHLPLQSGSSEILKKMNRHYTKEQYLELAERIRKAVPDISLTTDIIVGFPGETEEDFEETLEVVRKVRYDSAFTFIYSKRTGTPAAAMENQVPEEVVKERFDRLLAEVQAISAQVCGRDVHTVQEVLVEEPDSHVEGLVTGRMSNNTIVHFPGGKELIGKIVKVYLKESKGFYYMGSLVD